MNYYRYFKFASKTKTGDKYNQVCFKDVGFSLKHEYNIKARNQLIWQREKIFSSTRRLLIEIFHGFIIRNTHKFIVFDPSARRSVHNFCAWVSCCIYTATAKPSTNSCANVAALGPTETCFLPSLRIPPPVVITWFTLCFRCTCAYVN